MESFLKLIDKYAGRLLFLIASPFIIGIKAYMNNIQVKVSVLLTLIAITVILIGITVNGSTNLLVNETHFDTMNVIENTPASGVALVIASYMVLAHFIMGLMKNIENNVNPKSPSLLMFLMGKAFMLPRIKMVYASSSLGMSLSYFIQMEAVLIICHVICSILSTRKYANDFSIEGRAKVFKAIFLTDCIKTGLAFLLWLNSSGVGIIEHWFNRLPDMKSRIAVFLIIHVGLDIIQSIFTVFSLYLADICGCATPNPTDLPISDRLVINYYSTSNTNSGNVEEIGFYPYTYNFDKLTQFQKFIILFINYDYELALIVLKHKSTENEFAKYKQIVRDFKPSCIDRTPLKHYSRKYRIFGFLVFTTCILCYLVKKIFLR